MISISNVNGASNEPRRITIVRKRSRAPEEQPPDEEEMRMVLTNEQWSARIYPDISLQFDRDEWMQLGINWNLPLTLIEFLLLVQIAKGHDANDDEYAESKLPARYRELWKRAKEQEDEILDELTRKAQSMRPRRLSITHEVCTGPATATPDPVLPPPKRRSARGTIVVVRRPSSERRADIV